MAGSRHTRRVLDRLSPAQRGLLATWLPGAAPVADHSWGLVDSHVLELRRGTERYVVKASGPGNHHLARDGALADAFMEGYGDDPRRSPTYHAHLLAEAVGTAVTARTRSAGPRREGG